MKILHTADLHLDTDAAETLDGLDTLLETATDESVDLLTIGGSIFRTPMTNGTLARCLNPSVSR